MKKMILSALAALAVLPAQAQLFTRETLGSAAVGGLIGGIIGNNSHGRTGEGIAIGAGAGLLLGALNQESRRDSGYYRSYGYPGYTSYDYHYSPGYHYHYRPAPVYHYSRPNYAVGGTVLGGIAGGIIGNNSHGRTGEGIAIGAGAGLLLGSVAEYETRRREAVAYREPVVTTRTIANAPTVPDAPVAPEAPRLTLNNSAYHNSNPMSGANALFGR